VAAHPRTPEQRERENAQARARRAAGYQRPPRSARELEQSRLRARIAQRRLLGWPEERLGDPPVVRTRKPPSPRQAPAEPLPALATGHELYSAARALLRGYELAELAAGDMDAHAADLVAEYALAELEGRSGQEAMAAYRRARNKDRASCVYGLSTVTGLAR
jgi:hypothetical protein